MENDRYKKLPNRLKKYRRVRGLKQKEVAKILGLKSASMLSRWEKGICLPRPLNMFKMAILYRTMVDAVFVDLRRALLGEIRKQEEKVLRGRVKDNESREVKN